MKKSTLFAIIAGCALLATEVLRAQTSFGVPPFASTTGSPDVINLGSLNVLWTFPVVNKPGRGLPFNYNFVYNASVWSPSGSSWVPDQNWGWTGQVQLASGYAIYAITQSDCNIGTRTDPFYYYYDVITFKQYVDKAGTAHWLPPVHVYDDNTCSSYPPYHSLPYSATVWTSDGSGTSLLVTANPAATAYPAGGGSIVLPVTEAGTAGTTITDSNGNEITSSNGTSFTDTLGVNALSITGSAQSGAVTYTYQSTQGAENIVVAYSPYTVQTNFGCSGISEYGPVSQNLVTSITYPDNSSYTFTYEKTPGGSGNYTGRIATVKLPTGGTISYAYSGGNNGIICADGSAAGLTRVTPDSSSGTTYTRSNVSGTEWTTSVTDPYGDLTQIWFQNGSANYYETRRQIQGLVNGTLTLLRTIDTCYNTAAPDCRATAVALPITEQDAYTTLDNGVQSRVRTTFDPTYTLPLETDEYDYGANSPARKTIITYAPSEPPDRIGSVQITDGSGVQQALTNYYYDQPNTLTTTSGVPQHSGGGYGNLTEVSQWLSLSNTYLNTFMTYEDTGNVLTVKDGRLNTTNFYYDDSFGGGQTPNAHAYVTKVALPDTGSPAVHHITTAMYDINTGLVTKSVDQNGNAARYTYDALLRPKTVVHPQADSSGNHAETDYYYTAYSSPNPASIEVKQRQDANNWLDQVSLIDGLGRAIQTQLVSDPEGADTADTVYDALGRVYYVTNPFRSTSDPTYGATYYFYDALNRPIRIQDQDGNSSAASYSGNCASVSDETSRSRKLCSDGLGRLTSAVEPNPGSGSLTSGAYSTSYLYDALNNLKTVTQSGDGTGTARVRSFTYDSLSRMLTASNPESGTVCYGTENSPPTCDNNGYDPDGNLIYFTDARGTRTTLAYDQLNRLTQNSFSDGTAADSFFYDSLPDWTATNPIGNLLKQYKGFPGGGGGHYFSYDVMGRVTVQWDCLPSNCNAGATTQAGYDLAGHLTSLSYPSGRNVTETYSGAGRLYSVNFASFGGTPVNYSYWTAPYTSAGGWPSWNYYPSGFPHIGVPGNQTTEGAELNPRLQQSRSFTYLPGSVLAANHTVSYYDANGYNNGNILGITDSLNANHNQGFTYDQLNRITAGQQVDNSFNQTFSYDAWGNLNQAGAATGGTFNTANQWGGSTVGSCNVSTSTFCYDAAGNMTWDKVNTYAFDAESRIGCVNLTSGVCGQAGAVAAATYTYDAEGNRVRKDVSGIDPTEYVYFSGVPIAEHDPTTGDWSDYIYANGKRIVKADNFDNRIKTFTTVTANTGWQSVSYQFAALPAGLSTYQIQAGDKMFATQYQAYGRGGLDIWFSDGTRPQSNLHDSDGEMQDYDSRQGVWHQRSFDLTPYAGKTVSYLRLVTQGDTTGASNPWYEWYQGVAIVTASGQVFPFFYKQTSVSLSMGESSGNITPSYVAEHYQGLGASTTETTTYYHEDHLGTSRLLTSYGGWPVWQGTFMPFGQEVNAQATTNHYKFTGDEHDGDTEGNLEHTQFRQLSTVQGRWLSPDPYLGSMDLTNPQSLNRYSYALNSPCSMYDQLGLDVCALNIQVNNKSRLTQDQLTQIQNRINAVFGATPTSEGNTVAVNFVSSGGDYGLKFTPGNPNGNLGLTVGFGPFWFTPRVYTAATSNTYGNANFVIGTGTTAAHELIHRVTHIGDLPYTGPGDENLMTVDSAIQQGLGAAVAAADVSTTVQTFAQLTTDQSTALYNQCQKRHPAAGGGQGGGGGGGSGSGTSNPVNFGGGGFWVCTYTQSGDFFVPDHCDYYY